ncbi:MAG: HEAT repeat domain-containing protein [Gemmatimonadota bacterium]|nr:HEAT repeat domain-containing protein [Gemmatimonadota bacterium]
MSGWFEFLIGRPADQLLSLGEVLVILLVATTMVVLVTLVLACGALLLRRRTVSARSAMTVRHGGWQRSLQAVLYDGASAEDLTGSIAPASGTDFLNFLLLYVRRLDGSEREQICALAEPHLPRMVTLLTHRAAGRRMRAVQTLGELGLPGYGDQVIAALDDPSPLVAMVAASTLARAETPEYAGAVLAHLDRFAHWRQDFLSAMLASMGIGAASALRHALADDDATSRIRAVAADALAALSDPLAADPAAEVLGSSDDIELRAAALRLLASVGRAKHLSVVREHAAAEELPVRLAAIRALGRFGERTDLPPLEEAAREAPSPWVAIAAARALKEGGGVEALEALAGSQHPRSALGLQVISESRSW